MWVKTLISSDAPVRQMLCITTPHIPCTHLPDDCGWNVLFVSRRRLCFGRSCALPVLLQASSATNGCRIRHNMLKTTCGSSKRRPTTVAILWTERCLMDDGSVSFAKKQIHFFMEKSFQVSLGYVGQLIALAAVGKADALRTLSSSGRSCFNNCLRNPLSAESYLPDLINGMSLRDFERGYFVLLHTTTNSDNCQSVIPTWEVFVRIPDQLFGSRWWHTINGIFDNIYMLPLLVLIAVSSLLGFAYLCQWRTSLIAQVATLLLVVFYAVPCWVLFAAYRLNKLCRSHVSRDAREGLSKTFQAAMDAEQPTPADAQEAGG